ncbi:MBL fold metallo-hydrolase [Moheibacter lacus]|uniref:MBL fold metallo-hydrolase n=1 Tax=Moheibacter lacus TaxID=2745851 RepID=A0A838ZRQ8_9FLAO|nr:MBL fold metallo-hydrolase [Moheibacter lacus]MBA5628429.1 MBL fold metallo-hydrolase [Moheibacter lacus]
MQTHIMDLDFLDESSSIASFLIESSDGLILIESGPETTFDHLTIAIERKGFDWKDVRHVLLTHIHFDHAGAAWKFAENGAEIYVYPIGLPHLQNPEKLWNSAKMIYGDDMDRLWGEMKPIDEKLLVAADDGEVLKIGGLEIKVHYTPGHAVHHNAYQIENIIFTGDVAGVKINNGPVVPPCPPPDIDLGKWKKSIQKLKDLKPEKLYLTHFGIVEEVEKHLSELEIILEDWANWMKPYFDAETSAEEITPKFMDYTKNQLKKAGVSDEDLIRYEYANPSWMSVAGLLRYWKLKEQGRI